MSVNDKQVRDLWVLDTGCTSHMTSRTDWFCSFDEVSPTTILLGDNHSVESQGQGSILVNTNGGSIKILEKVKYVPNLRRNLISTSTLDKLGFKHEGGARKVRYFKGHKTTLRGNLSNGLYILDGNTVATENCIGEGLSNKSDLWHSRLDHLGISNMKILADKGYLDRKEIKELEFCEHCVMGKSKKVSFNVGKHNLEEALEYVHADLSGSPNVTPSLSGNKYFLSIIDDKTRKVWLFFLKTKDETFERFCEWKELVENQTGKKVKCLRTDNGLEFCNTKFDAYCKKHGIDRNRTCAYTPQQNGVAERMNRTVMEKVRCLLDESGLAEKFLAEAAATAAYLINRSPSSAVDHSIPEELWLNRKPGLKHLRRFGSVAYVHHDQGKLKPRALKGVFVGYSVSIKGYKVWLLDEEKCVISRNVKFQEEIVYKNVNGANKSDQNTEEQIIIHNNDNLTEKLTMKSKVGESSKSGGVVSVETDSESDTEVTTDAEAAVNQPISSESDGLANYQLARDRTRRDIRAPARFSEDNEVTFALITVESLNLEEPESFAEAMQDENSLKWKCAAHEEKLIHWQRMEHGI